MEEPRKLRVRKPQVKVPPFNESSIKDTSAVADKENQDDNDRLVHFKIGLLVVSFILIFLILLDPS